MRIVCPRPRLAYYADGHVPAKRDAFNGRAGCGVSRGQGSCGVFCLAFGRILRDHFYGNGMGGVGARGDRLIPFYLNRYSSCVLRMDHNGN